MYIILPKRADKIKRLKRNGSHENTECLMGAPKFSLIFSLKRLSANITA